MPDFLISILWFSATVGGNPLITAGLNAMSPRKLANWYHQLASLTEAGIPLAQALREASGPPAGDRREMARKLDSGISLDEMLRQAPGWMPLSDRYYISAGAATGKIPAIFKQLAAQYDGLAAQTSRLLFAAIYPLAIVHIAALLLPAVGRIDFQVEESGQPLMSGYAVDVLAVLVPLWAVLGLIFALYRLRPGVLYLAGRWVPLVSRSLKFRGLANFCRAMGIFLEAGLRIDHAWAGATLLSNSPNLQRQARSAEAAIRSGSSPLSVIQRMPAFPPEFESFYAAGERTGQLPENMFRLAGRFDDKARQWTFSAIALYPSLLFIAIAVYIAITVISFYSSYFRFIEEMW